jgi:hypothetical protein
METASSNTALVCVVSTSVTNCQNVLPVPSSVLPSNTCTEEITSSRLQKSREIESVISLNTSGFQCQKMQRKKSMKTDIHNQETAGDFERQFYESLKNYVPKTV